MENPPAPTEDLRAFKKRYLLLFYALFIGNPAVRVLQNFYPSPLFGLLGIGVFCAAIWLLVMTYQFAGMLGYGMGITVVMLVISLIPLVNLLVVLRLIKKYRELTGLKTDFFLFDKAPAPIERLGL